MTTHAFHDDILVAGLDDHCDRCRELAEDPVANLDAENLVRILAGHVYSDLDREVLARLSWLASQYERLQEIVGLPVTRLRVIR